MISEALDIFLVFTGLVLFVSLLGLAVAISMAVSFLVFENKKKSKK